MPSQEMLTKLNEDLQQVDEEFGRFVAALRNGLEPSFQELYRLHGLLHAVAVQTAAALRQPAGDPVPDTGEDAVQSGAVQVVVDTTATTDSLLKGFGF